jgi:hypothetical protein
MPQSEMFECLKAVGCSEKSSDNSCLINFQICFQETTANTSTLIWRKTTKFAKIEEK